MTQDRISGIHARVHPTFTEGCFPCRIATVQAAPSAMGTRGKGAEVAETNRREKQLHKDRDSYARLRKDGLQPNNVDGSAALEANVKDQIELDYKIPIPAKDLPRVKEIQQEVAASQQAPSW